MSDEAKPLDGHRVAVVCGHFLPQLGYQEVDLANAFRRLGAQVRVVTSTRLSQNARKIAATTSWLTGMTSGGHDLVRLAPRFTVGPNLFGCKVLPVIEEFAPDYVVLVGPGKLFGLEIFESERAPWRRVAIVQDNSEDSRSTERSRWRRRSRAVAHRLVKQAAYRRVVRNADRIVLNTPDTRDVIDPWLGATERHLLDVKGLESRLGFDPEIFFFDLEGREAWRGRHGMAENDLLLATCTRAAPGKRLEDVINAVSRLRDDGLAIRYVLAGLLDDEYGQRLRRQAARQADPDAFLLLPLQRHDQMRELFSACDLGFWTQAAITIQQAMGTGLPVVLTSRPTVSHLVTEGRNGWYVQPHQTFDEVLTAAVTGMRGTTSEGRVDRRMAGAAFNRTYLSYDRIALELVAGLE